MAVNRIDWKPGEFPSQKAIEMAIVVRHAGEDESLESYKERIDEMPC